MFPLTFLLPTSPPRTQHGNSINIANQASILTMKLLTLFRSAINAGSPSLSLDDTSVGVFSNLPSKFCSSSLISNTIWIKANMATRYLHSFHTWGNW